MYLTLVNTIRTTNIDHIELQVTQGYRKHTNVYEADDIMGTRLSLAIDSQSQWVATMYVDNVANEDGRVRHGGRFPEEATRVRPRTVGLQVEYSY